MQTHALTIIESVAHATLGFVLGFIVVLLLDSYGEYIGLGIEVDMLTNLYISLIITVINLIKSYMLRRYFTKLRK